jgi:hypothetical protein
MVDDAPQLPQEKDPDLERWARELGVTYEELVSTLDYAGRTFRDAGELTPVETPVSPTDRADPSPPDSGNSPAAPAPRIAAATQIPR